MRRREFIAGTASILAGTLSTRAGAAVSWRIGQVFGGSSEIISSSGLEQGLSTLGYIDGKNIRLQTRFAAPNLNEMKAAVLALLPDIDLLVVWGTIGGVAAKAVAPNIPVVFISVGAPVDIGLVQSLAHPGGNMTGTTFEAASETYGKRLQLLKEILPDLSRVAVIGAKNDPNFPFAMTSLGKSAPLLHVSLTAVEVSSDDDLIRAFDRVKRDRLEAVIVVAGAFTYAKQQGDRRSRFGEWRAVLSRLQGDRRRRWLDQPRAGSDDSRPSGRQFDRQNNPSPRRSAGRAAYAIPHEHQSQDR